MKLTINNVEVDDQGIRALFAQLQARLEDMTPVFREIGEIILESIQSNIRAGESPDGVSWPQSIRAKFEGGATLMDTRTHLYNSLNVQAEKNEVTVGSNWKYAHVHQLGAIIRPKNKKALRFVLADGSVVFARKAVIPARPFMGVKEEDWEEIKDALTDHLMEAIR